jgi:hypothetical protein
MGLGDKDNFTDFEVKNGTFNQALYQQNRLDDILSAYDKLVINPFLFNQQFQLYNYEVVLELLNQVFSNIYGLLTPQEKKEGIKLQEELYKSFDLKRPFDVYKTKDGTSQKINKANSHLIRRKLNYYRWKLDEFLENHDLLNPTKAKVNPNSAIIMN